MPKVDYPLAELVDSQHPLLRKALDAVRPGYSTTVEWMTAEGEQKNYMQVARTPFVGGERERWRAFERHLDSIESTLWDGVPTRDMSGVYPLTLCGGVRHYLGRDPLRADVISFRPLQDCVLFGDVDQGEFEFLTEFSLEVIPAPAIKRRA